MRPFWLAAAAGLVGDAGAKCTEDSCLRAVRQAAPGSRNADCEALFRVTITPPTSTLFSTVISRTTATTTSTTTEAEKATPTVAPSKRWQNQHDVVDILLRRVNASTTSSSSAPQKTPSYASLCNSVKAYSSACSCLGFKHTTMTLATPLITLTVKIREAATVTAIETFLTTESHVIASNSSTPGIKATSTDSAKSSAQGTSSVQESSRIASDSVGSSAETVREIPSDTTAPGIAISGNEDPASSTVSSSDSERNSSKTERFTNATSSSKPLYTNGTALLSNETSAHPSVNAPSIGHYFSPTGVAVLANVTSNSHHINATKLSAVLDVTSTDRFLNTTSAMPAANTMSVRTHLNTTTAPFLDGTNAAQSFNKTSLSLLNSTDFHIANATTRASFLNATSTVPHLNGTGPLLLNNTRIPLANATTWAPLLNLTSASFSNASTATTSSSPTATLDTTCGTTAEPFFVQVSQPSGPFNGWFLKLSGDMVIFSSSANHSSKFSVESSGHLCAVGYLGESGNPIVAIVEDKDGLTGSAVYFVDGANMEQFGPRGYDYLACSVDDDLACSLDSMANWVGCGLGLDISSDSGQNVVVDTWNCTSIALSVIYE